MDQALKKKLIGDYKEGEPVSDIFVVKIRKGISPASNGKYFFSLILTDASGKSIDYRYWGGPKEEKVKELYDSIKDDSVVKIFGKVSSYKDKLQITSDEPQSPVVLTPNEYDSSSFIKRTKKDVDQLYSQIEAHIDSIKDEKLKLLLNSLFKEEIKDKFKRHPAAISVHHNWIGGLLEHTLEVVKYCKTSKEIFPELNEDLLIAGAILHDIGKLEEMEMTTRIKGTNIGMFSGHIVLGSILVSAKMKELGFDDSLRDKVLHMIVSHHGKVENGSVKEPMLPEALAIYYADEVSSKLSEILSFVENNKKDTEDDFMPKWEKNKVTNIFLR